MQRQLSLSENEDEASKEEDSVPLGIFFVGFFV